MKKQGKLKGRFQKRSWNTSGERRYNKKTTCICPEADCNYSARQYIWNRDHEFVAHSASCTCPVHNVDLVDIGDCNRLPKVRSSKYRKMKKRLLTWATE